MAELALKLYMRHQNWCDTQKHPSQPGPFDCTCGLEPATAELKRVTRERDEALAVLADRQMETRLGVENLHLRNLIKRVEWGTNGDECPWCRYSNYRHGSDCPAFTKSGEVRSMPLPPESLLPVA